MSVVRQCGRVQTTKTCTGSCNAPLGGDDPRAGQLVYSLTFGFCCSCQTDHHERELVESLARSLAREIEAAKKAAGGMTQSNLSIYRWANGRC